MKTEIKAGVWYLVIRGGDDGTLREGDHVILEFDGCLVCIEAEGFIPHEDVEEALQGAVLEIDKEWTAQKKQEHIDALAKLEAL